MSIQYQTNVLSVSYTKTRYIYIMVYLALNSGDLPFSTFFVYAIPKREGA